MTVFCWSNDTSTKVISPSRVVLIKKRRSITDPGGLPTPTELPTLVDT